MYCPVGKSNLCFLVPVSLFVSFCSIALPGMMDIRLFYILAAILFGFNATYVGSAEAMPFYLITSGDLVRLIWVHPRWPFVDMGSVIANGFFLAGKRSCVWQPAVFETQVLEVRMKARIESEVKIFGINFFIVSAAFTVAMIVLSIIAGDLLDFYPVSF